MEVLQLLEQMEDILEKSTSIPLSGKILIDKEQFINIINEIRLKLPDEIKKAEWIKQERKRIIIEAQKEAEAIINDAERKIKKMVEESEITKLAMEQANEIISNAKKNAREIRIGTREYADGLLSKIEVSLMEALKIIQNNREELKGLKD